MSTRRAPAAHPAGLAAATGQMSRLGIVLQAGNAVHKPTAPKVAPTEGLSDPIPVLPGGEMIYVCDYFELMPLLKWHLLNELGSTALDEIPGMEGRVSGWGNEYTKVIEPVLKKYNYGHADVQFAGKNLVRAAVTFIETEVEFLSDEITSRYVFEQMVQKFAIWFVREFDG